MPCITIDDDACFTMPGERGSGPYAHSWASRQQNLLECQRPVVIVRQVRTGPRASGGLEQLLALILTVVNLNVAGKASTKMQLVSPS